MALRFSVFCNSLPFQVLAHQAVSRTSNMQVRWPVHFGLASDLYAKMLGNRTQSSVGARQLCFLEPKFRVFMVDKHGITYSFFSPRTATDHIGTHEHCYQSPCPHHPRSSHMHYALRHCAVLSWDSGIFRYSITSHNLLAKAKNPRPNSKNSPWHSLRNSGSCP